MDEYLHVIDLTKELKCVNLAHSRTLHSLFMLQIIVPKANPIHNPINLTEQELRDCSPDTVPGPASPMMEYLYRASFNRKYMMAESSVTIKHARRAEVEIQFELRRRVVNPNATSRLSALYLVENNEDGAITLRGMFIDVLEEPQVLRVDILNKLDGTDLLRADHRWYEQYYETPSEEIIDNYWAGKPFDDGSPSWEFLLEGSVRLLDSDVWDYINDLARQRWPNSF